MSDPRYPIGKFEIPTDLDAAKRAAWIEAIAATPANLRAAVAGLTDAQLDTPYREGGWTVRQVVHHTADSHMNSFIRFKLALTEETPHIKPYDENEWAKTPEVRDPIDDSLAILDALHRRWVSLLNGMSDADFKRAFFHPDHGPIPLGIAAALYAWHGAHHVAHVVHLRRQNGW
jgi:uncharacterized damage-inducible protein DinB